MASKIPGVIVAGVAAVAATALVFAVVRWQASKAIVAAGFRFDPGSYAPPAEPTRQLGGPLTESEIASIKTIC